MLGDDVCVVGLEPGVLCATAEATKNANATQIDSDIFFIATLLLLNFDDRPFRGLSDRPVFVMRRRSDWPRLQHWGTFLAQHTMNCC